VGELYEVILQLSRKKPQKKTDKLSTRIPVLLFAAWQRQISPVLSSGGRIKKMPPGNEADGIFYWNN